MFWRGNQPRLESGSSERHALCYVANSQIASVVTCMRASVVTGMQTKACLVVRSKNSPCSHRNANTHKI
jgi:hypothetical protein